MSLEMYKEEKAASGVSQVRHIWAVAAGKGGVGKSSVAVNLSLALQRQGRAVGLLDADIYGPSVRKMLGEDRYPKQIGEQLEPGESQGILLMTMAYFQKENEATVVRAPLANAMISQFIQQTQWGPLDDLILDFPPGTGDIQLTLCQKLPLAGALMVTTPQQVAVDDVRKAMDMFKRVHVPIVGILENMSYLSLDQGEKRLELFGKGGGEALASEEAIPFLGKLPLDPEFSSFCDKGLFLFKEKPESELAQAFDHLALTLVDLAQSRNKR